MVMEPFLHRLGHSQFECVCLKREDNCHDLLLRKLLLFENPFPEGLAPLWRLQYTQKFLLQDDLRCGDHAWTVTTCKTDVAAQRTKAERRDEALSLLAEEYIENVAKEFMEWIIACSPNTSSGMNISSSSILDAEFQEHL